MANYVIDLSSMYIWTFAAGIFLMKCWHSWLSWKNRNYILSTEGKAMGIISGIHELGAKMFSEEKLANALKYSRFHESFGRLYARVSSLLSHGLFCIGLMPFLLHWLNAQNGLPVWLSIAGTTAMVSLVDIFLDMPFNWYQNFRLEDKFGFNTMTLKTFFTDIIKSYAVSTVMTFIVVFLVVDLLAWYHSCFGKVDIMFCIAVTAASPVLSLVYELIHFKLIDPLFNKMSKLENESLVQRIDKMMEDAGYSKCKVFAVDTSKRSKHSNAYFAGWGNSKRLVLSDTLLKTMSDDEVLAIVGHELGHAKCHHLVISRIMSMVGSFFFMWAASYVMYNIDLMHAFGYRFIDTPEMMMSYSVIGIMLFSKMWGAFSWVLDGISSCISQKMEYAADAMSAKFMKTSDSMISSLFKLYVDNMSYPLVDKTFEMWNYSHPSLLNRVKALKELNAEKETK